MCMYLPDVPVDSSEVVTAAIKIIAARIGTAARILDMKKSNNTTTRTYSVEQQRQKRNRIKCAEN